MMPVLSFLTRRFSSLRNSSVHGQSSRRSLRGLGLALATCGLVSGCLPASPPPTVHISPREEAAQTQNEVAWVYTCNDGTRMTALFDADSVRLFLPGRSVMMRYISTGENGARYDRDGDVFVTHGENAILTQHGMPSRSCIGSKGPGPWELARLAGVDFRAVGHHPNWTLEMDQEGAIVLTGESVGGRATFPWSRPEHTDDRALWNSRSHGEMLTILVVKRPCLDEETNEQFEATVTAILDNRTYQGCGRALEGNKP